MVISIQNRNEWSAKNDDDSHTIENDIELEMERRSERKKCHTFGRRSVDRLSTINRSNDRHFALIALPYRRIHIYILLVLQATSSNQLTKYYVCTHLVWKSLMPFNWISASMFATRFFFYACMCVCVCKRFCFGFLDNSSRCTFYLHK